MSIFYVDVHHLIHTCPANSTPHAVESTRTIVAEFPGGPCRTPYKVNGTVLPCHRIAPMDKQCPACKTQVFINNSTMTDLGYQGPACVLFEVAK